MREHSDQGYTQQYPITGPGAYRLKDLIHHITVEETTNRIKRKSMLKVAAPLPGLSVLQNSVYCLRDCWTIHDKTAFF
jgi:hypothetical protein